MSKFHSMVSRRDFMKFMGYTGMGVGAAVAASGPVFHDLDELLSADTGNIQKRPWYVKERDFYNPTVEVDWDVLKRPNPFHTGQNKATCVMYMGQERADNQNKLGYQYVNQQIQSGAPGYSYLNRALRKVNVTYGWPAYMGKSWAGNSVNINWKGDTDMESTNRQKETTIYYDTPEERGEPKWTGTPEEATKVMAAFMRYRGSAINGFGILDQRMRTQVVSKSQKHSDKRVIVFEDVEKAYEVSGGKYVIPNKELYYFVNWELMARELFRCTPAFGGLANASDMVGDIVKASTWDFLRYLGYQMIGAGSDNTVPFVEGAVANLTGVCENSRNQLYCLNPEYGAIGRLHSYITDLPMAPTKPVDAGMWRFCHSCHKCANTCPSGSISQEKQPSWEITPIKGKESLIHNPGTKEFWSDGVGCRLFRNENGGVGGNEIAGCQVCWGECTFTVDNAAMVHNLIKGTVANVSIFNGFFFKMGETFGYGSSDEKSDEWWDLSLPVMGIDTTTVAYDKGYRK
ncbi:reductive dehalogenase [Dehalogenimonas etheniformans]|nr:reductive dehalogenase [Dehalogenimonas etheniformans]QNT75697.1 reductive dehalogenase [Dehalogenimonas etheniformans]